MTSTPLAGIRVIDLTQIYQGPYAAFLMAAAGADVIKVEPPSGERLRGRGGEFTPLSFVMLNSNKRSVTLDLKSAEGKELLKQLVADADVLLENFAPGVMDRLDLGWDVLHELNPTLIYGSGTGYGLSGPDRDQLAMDHTIQAASGVMSSTGNEGQPPARAGGAPSDLIGGVHLYAGVMSALVGRGTTGKGSRVEVSMLEAMFFTLCSEFAAYHARGEVPPRNSARSPSGASPYGIYRCADGWIAIICVAESHWQAIARTIGRANILETDEFDAAHKRKKREAEIGEMIEAWSGKLSRDEAFARMREAKVPVAPVKTLDEVYKDPHLLARGALTPMLHPELGALNLPSSPIRYSDYDPVPVAFFPDPGQHNAEIYGELPGISSEILASYAERGII